MISAEKAFSRFLEPYFPQDQYGKDKTIVAHHLVHNKNLQGLQKWLPSGDAAKVAARVSAVATPYRLTPLHLATMLKEREIVEYLLSTTKLDVNAKDSQGWTPLHFAALVNDVAIEELLKKQGAKVEEDPFVASPVDIRRLVYFQKDPKSQIFFYQEEDREIQGDGEVFCKLTGAAAYADEELHFSPQEMVKSWSEPNIRIEERPETKEQYLRLRETAARSLRLVRREGVGFELQTRRKFKKGELICEYLGEICSDRAFSQPFVQFLVSSEEDYLLEKIDSTKFRSLQAMVNDGAPNCDSIPLYNLLGVKERSVLVALEDLEEGTILRSHYGLRHRVKFGPHKEADLEMALEKYKLLNRERKIDVSSFRKASKELSAQLSKGGGFVAGKIDGAKLVSLLHYLVETPSFAATLVIHGVVSANQVQQVLECIHPSQPGKRGIDYVLRTFVGMLQKIPEGKIKALSKKQREDIVRTIETKDFNEILTTLQTHFPNCGIASLIFHSA